MQYLVPEDGVQGRFEDLLSKYFTISELARISRCTKKIESSSAQMLSHDRW